MEQTILQKLSWLKKRSNSFTCAWKGIRIFLQTEVHARIHFSATLINLMMAFYFHLTQMEWIVIIFAIAMVWLAEMMNTAVEKILDLLHPGHHPLAGRIKDMAAGAVLISALTALAMGLIIFIPKIFL
jgi:diacylglycerol kinase